MDTEEEFNIHAVNKVLCRISLGMESYKHDPPNKDIDSEYALELFESMLSWQKNLNKVIIYLEGTK